MTNVILAIGKAYNASEVVDILELIAPVRVVEAPPYRRYVGAPEKGIDLLFENEHVISVQIYTQATRSFSAYQYPLPFKLAPVMNRDEVHKMLGEPIELSDISSTYVMKESGIRLVITYDVQLNMRLISLGSLNR